MGLVGEALMLLSVLRRVLAVLRVLRGVWRVLLRVLTVGRVLPVLGVRSVLGVLTVLTVLGVLAVLVVGAAVLREMLRVRRAVAGVGLGRMGQGHLATVGRVAVGVAVGLVV